MSDTYKKIVTTETVTKTSYEVDCVTCGKTWTTTKPPSLPFECHPCREDRREREFQEGHKHLIGARITAVVSDGDASRPDVKHIVICDDSGDYWKVIGERDYEYGAYIGIEEYEGDEKRE